MHPRLKRTAAIAKEVWHEWRHDNAMMLAAAVAFYATFSLAPLLVLLLNVAALLLGEDDARSRLLELVTASVSQKAARATDRILDAATEAESGTTILSVILLVAAASAIFRYLRLALNLVLDVPTREDSGFFRIIRKRLFSALIAVVAILLLVAALAATAMLEWAGANAPGMLQWAPLWSALRLLLTLAVLAIGFGAILRYVPDVELKWGHVMLGASLASLTFAGGQFLIATYLARSSLASAYGAAGSIVLLLVYICFTVALLLAAAELTEVLARDDSEFRSKRRQLRAEEGQAPRKDDVVAGA